MSKTPEANGDVVEFSWGKKRGVGKDKGIQFYESFKYDGAEYWLYDHVFMFKDGIDVPFVGKIVKAWEMTGGNKPKKRVKIHWLFRPGEVSTHLGDVKHAGNELFLASGKGRGTSNVNELEAIGGKCHVICTSKDERNPLPSPEDLKLADFIFYRTFDVETFEISDQLEGAIEGVEVKFIFNREGKNIGIVDKAKEIKAPEHVIKDEGTLTVFVEEKPQPVQVKGPLDVSDDRPTKKARSESSQQVKAEPKSTLDDEKVTPVANRTDSKPKINSEKGSVEVEKKAVEGAKKASGNIKLENMQNKLLDGSLKKSITSDVSKDSVEVDKKVSENLKLENKQIMLREGSFKKSVSDSVANSDSKGEVAKRPESDRSKWFAQVPWDTKLKNAHDQERLVLLDNLDPDLSQAEIEDILFEIFKQNCSVRLIEQSTFTNPHHGQALAVFKTSEAADQAVLKLSNEILMLPNGRPLIARKGITRSPDQKSSAIIGMLSIEKYSKQRKFKEDQRKAAFASHYSQGNTIEFEMAIEWMLLHTKSQSWWDELHEANRQEIKKITHDLKTK